MKTFNINMVLSREQNDSEFDHINQVKNEIISWLEDLDFTVDFSKETYDEKAKDILWEYISYSDIPEITKRLEEIEKNEV